MRLLLFTILLIFNICQAVYYISVNYPLNPSEELNDLVSGRFENLPDTNPCIHPGSDTTLLQPAFFVNYNLPTQSRTFLTINDARITSLRHIFKIFDVDWPGCINFLTGIGTPSVYPHQFIATPLDIIAQQLEKINNVHPSCIEHCGLDASCLCELQMSCPVVTTENDSFMITYIPTCIEPYQCTGSGEVGLCFEGNIKEYSLSRIFLNRYETITFDYFSTVTSISRYLSQCLLSPRFVYADTTNSTVVIYGATSPSMRAAQPCSYAALSQLALSLNFYIYSFDNQLAYNIQQCAPSTVITIPTLPIPGGGIDEDETEPPLPPPKQQPVFPGPLACGTTSTLNCTALKCPLFSTCSTDIDCIYGLCINKMCKPPQITTPNKEAQLVPRLNVFYNQTILSFSFTYFISMGFILCSIVLFMM